jgi:hypothetical protein
VTKFIDLTGQKFGKLLVIRRMENNKRGEAEWECLCDCGKICITVCSRLRNKNTRSCGCTRKNFLKSRTPNLLGYKFGKLLVIERIRNDEHKRSKWKCLCDCGKISIVSGKNLKNGKVRSCGCLIKTKYSYPYGDTSFNMIFSGYKASAKRRNLNFCLSKEEFKKLIKENCFYCGKEPCQIKKSKKGNGEFVYNGLDRIDSSKGYNMNNVVPCCGKCNESKMALSQQEFLSWVERVYNHSIKDKEK